MTTRSAAEIFQEARELPAEQRDAYLLGACGRDAALRAKVEALLKADAEAGDFLAAPPASPTTPGEAAGTQIDRYKLLEKIGEGGMGTIWMAEQREPVRRRVALKIIKLGMDTKQVIARFEAERQALALMDHPHIAKVLDAGATETGRPYFVMEYIRGIPILEYCDTERLDTRARLELFTSVCHAIQHAHQKGIIHRDIKPSNVLVTLHDGVPVPKVIDFGIAKATHSELTTKTLFTEHRQMIGTPAYMSPEQAEMSGLDIDTRSDIYSLGVLLYELLTGTVPFDTKALLESGFDEMLRAIREDEPHTPSTRVSKLGDTGSRTALQRKVEVKKLSLLLRGDLDWIVMMCLEKDRTRRYETANGLAADIRRHLHDEPVTAGAPSAAYRLRKFLKRHRAKVIAATAMMAALLIAIVGTAWGLVESNRARSAQLQHDFEDEQRSAVEDTRLASNAEAVAALLGQCEEALHAGDAAKATLALDAARARADEGGAEGEAERVEQLAADLELMDELDAIDQFLWTWSRDNFANPEVGATRTREALRRYGADPESASVEEAAARANASAIRERIVMALDGLLFRERAESLRALLRRVDADPYRDSFRDAVVARDPLKVQALARDPAVLEQPLEFAAALGQSRLLPVERRRELLELAALRRPSSLALSMTLQGTYKFEEPETANERIRWLQAARAADPRSFAACINLSTALVDAGRLEEAIACNRRVLEIEPGSALACTNLGAVLERQAFSHNGTVLVSADKRDESIACYRKAIELDPDWAMAHFNLGFQMSKLGKAEEAIACYRRSIEIEPKYARVHGALAEDLWTLRRFDEAIVSFRTAIELDPKWAVPVRRLAELQMSLGRDEEAIEGFRKNLALDPTSAYVHACLGSLLRKKGQLDEAIALFRKAIEIDPKYDAYGGLGAALWQRGEVDEAIALMRKSLEIRPDHAAGMCTLGEILLARGRPDEALAWAQKAVALAPKDARAVRLRSFAQGAKGRADETLEECREAVESDPDNAECHLDLALALQTSGQRDAAIESFRRTIELDPTQSRAQYNMGCYLKDERRWDEAIACYRKAIESSPDFAEPHCNLGQCLMVLGAYAEALQSYRRGHELGSKLADWSYPSAEWIRGAEKKAALEANLPALLAGGLEPVDNAERLEYAAMCWKKGLLHAEVRLLSAAFAADPEVADDLGAGHRFDAACSAALLSAGRGKDSAPLDERERARLRQQAIDWLRADLDLHARRSASGKPEERAATKEKLRKWQEDAELTCIRDPAELASLPAEDRDALVRLWADVAALLAGESR